MRILIATGLYPPEIGGPATYTKLLEERLPALGIEVGVLPFRTVRHLPPLVRHLAYFFKLLSASRGAQAIFAQDTVSVGLPAALACMLMGKSFLVRVPGDYAWEQGRQRYGVQDGIDEFQHLRYGAKVGVLRAVQRFVVQRARYVVVPSNYFGRVVSGWGVRPEHLRVVYNGVDPAHPEEPKAAPAHPYMVSAGRLVPWKGFDVLIRLLPTLPGWSLVLVGDGPDKRSLAELAQKEGVVDRVIFTGELTRPQVLGWCKAADAFVLNTSFESFSFQIVEAMMVGARVITTSIGSIPELVESGKEGMLLAPNDTDAFRKAVLSLQAEREAWEARRDAAKKKSEFFSIDNTVRNTFELLKNL